VRAQAVRVTIDEGTRRRLERIAGSVKAEVRAVVRAKIVLAAAAGASNETIARTVGVSVNTVRKWRGRFAAQGLKGSMPSPSRTTPPPSPTGGPTTALRSRPRDPQRINAVQH
jgi:hypothetical protein